MSTSKISKSKSTRVAPMSAEEVADVMLGAASAFKIAKEHAKIAEKFGAEADVALALSAKVTATAIAGGVSALKIATAAKSAALLAGFRPADVYSSPASVGYHKRTGDALHKGGTLPDGVSVRDLQSKMRVLCQNKRTAEADAILAKSGDVVAVWDALVKATKPAKPAKPPVTPPADDTDTDTDTDTGEESATVSDLLRAAAEAVRDAITLGDWNADDVTVARDMVANLGRYADVVVASAPVAAV